MMGLKWLIKVEFDYLGMRVIAISFTPNGIIAILKNSNTALVKSPLTTRQKTLSLLLKDLMILYHLVLEAILWNEDVF